MPTRPSLSDALTEQEFRRWYWTMAELQPFARSMGLGATGPKLALTERIAAHLGNRTLPKSPTRKTPSQQISGPLTRETQIPPGQRSTLSLRTFFEEEIGRAFRFNGHMRAFLRKGGATLGDAVEHWYETVGTPLPQQSTSLEFNKFTHEWHLRHPDGTAADCRAAWARYRKLPTDQRPDLADA